MISSLKYTQSSICLAYAKAVRSLFKVFDNKKKGLGGAINLGIENTIGDYICVMMADLSDDFNDLKNYYTRIKDKNLDAVFGSRFTKKSKVIDYPFKKLILNRIFNTIVQILFLNKYNDYTNAFKIYDAKVLRDVFWQSQHCCPWNNHQ